MTAPAPLTPDTLKFIRETARTANVRDIACELGWDVARLRNIVRTRIPGLHLNGDDDDPAKPKVYHSSRRKTKDPLDAILKALELRQPTARDLIIVLRRNQRGQDFVTSHELAGSLDITTGAVLSRIQRARDALATSPFDIVTKRVARGTVGYRFVERGNDE